MRSTDDDAEARVLTTGEGRRLLDAVSGVAAPRPADLGRWRKEAPAALVAAALRLAEGRRRGAAKFARAGEMWFDATGVEQATAEGVARHKARRLAAGGRHATVVDLCAGIGGDSMAMAAAGARVLAVDADHGMARRCRWNAGVHGVGDRVLPIRARAERFAIPAGALVHVDPDRRARAREGPRARSLRDYAPGLDFLRTLAAETLGGAIKLGPASDFAGHFDAPAYEVELISLDGECKEATAWFGALASSGCRRRATRLPGGATWTDRDGDPAARVPIVPPSSWVYDPDPALVRSGLLDGFAAAHGLSRCAPGVDYLTTDARFTSPFLAAFEVLDVFPLDVKTLRRVVHERSLGPLEIKTRGLDVRPETLRDRLRPPGSSPATLLLMGGSAPARAVLARRAGVLSGGPAVGTPSSLNEVTTLSGLEPGHGVNRGSCNGDQVVTEPRDQEERRS